MENYYDKIIQILIVILDYKAKSKLTDVLNKSRRKIDSIYLTVELKK